MGTFHHDRGALHGITVVVDTQGPRVYVGRCDSEGPDGIVLLDVDVHADGDGGRSKADYLRQVARVGHWKKHDRVEVAAAEIVSVRRLGDMALD